MEIRKLLCDKCKAKVRTAESIYQQERRKKIKVGDNKIKTKNYELRKTNN